MQIDINKVMIVVTVPRDYVEKIREEVCKEGAGIMGNYTFCTMASDCIGTFVPTDEANPFIGQKNKLEFVNEVKLEVMCDISIAKRVLNRIREVHPYEEPGIYMAPLIDEKSL